MRSHRLPILRGAAARLGAAVAAAIAFVFTGISPATAGPIDAAVHGLEQAAGAPVEVARSHENGLVTFMSAAGAPVPLGVSAASAPETRARAFLAIHGRAFGIAGDPNVAHFRSHGPDEVGMEHVRFQQLHGGIPVTGGELTVHLRGAAVVAVNSKTLDVEPNVPVTPAITADEALATAEALIAKHFAVTDAVYSTPRLEVFNRGMLTGNRAATHLAWFIEATRIDLRQFIWIDATTGARLLDFSQLTDALNRSVYTAGGGSTLPGTLVRSEGGAPTGDADADAAYRFAGDTYNYYLTQHGRDSFDGAGAPILSTVHYCPSNDNCNYQNAFWNGTQMVYGNGFASADDVDAHELTHAVTEHSARLFYYMQSGALNESFSDIFGETVDLMNGAGTDTPAVRWLMGEDIPGIGAIRNMMNPNQFGDPGKTSDSAQFACQPSSDVGGVHTNSGVPNHAYALMVDGGTYNGFTIAGIGLVKAGKIEYRALTTYLVSGSGFVDDYNALKQSCSDLIGTVGITAADCTEVGKALDAVEMSHPWPCSSPPVATPDLCPAGVTPVTLFFDDFENTASANWAVTALGGTTHWFYPPPADFVFATSGVQNLWGYDEPSVGDSAMAMTRSVAIPAAGARLQFNHSYGFENSGVIDYDGGVIEYSTNGGLSWSDAGSLITAGAVYGGAISSCCGNPLAGRNAFVNDSFGYTASQLDLGTLAGQNVRFRFRIGTDQAVDDYGWFIDDVRIYQCPSAQTPDLAMSAAHSGSFTQGQTGAVYTLTVRNVGGNPTNGTVTVADTLPSSLSATAISGTGWACTQPGGPCTRSDALAAGGSYPALTLTVNVALNAPGTLTNVAAVSGGGDANAANNSASDPTVINPALPDLVETSVSNPPAAAAPGSSFTVTDQAKNAGGGTAAASKTRYYLSVNAVRDAGDTLLTGSRSVPTLVAATTSTGSATVTIPASTTPGAYFLLACADDTLAVVESNESNNCLASSTTIQVARPDLLVTAVSNPPAGSAPGTHFTVTDTVKNQGVVAAGASMTRYYLSADAQKGAGDTLLTGSRSVPGLAAGASSAGGAVTVTIPSAAPLGTYFLLACADDLAVVVEGNEANNCLASATTVLVTRPDLVVTALSNPPGSIAPGGHFTVTDTVRNQGAVGAAASTTRYYLSADVQKSAGDTLLTGSRAVPALAAGTTSAGGAVTVTIPSTMPLGTYALLACADDMAVVAESDETNNCRVSATMVQVARPDLVVTAVSNPPATAVAGTNFTVTDSVLNQGGLASGVSTTRYYLSVDTMKAAGDTLLTGSRAVPALAAGGASAGAAITVTIPSATPANTYFLLACADDTAVVAEGVETNNCRAAVSRVIVSR